MARARRAAREVGDRGGGGPRRRARRTPTPRPRPELLRALAEATGGAFSALPDGGLPDLRLTDPEVVEIGRRKAVPIWDRWWTLAALAAALAAEWVLRRRWGYW